LQDNDTFNKEALKPHLSPNSGEDGRKIVSEKSRQSLGKGEITVGCTV
jgi:hypothetical protein